MVVTLLATSGLATWAQQESPPDGIPVGKALLAPWFEADFLVDDNIFRRSGDNFFPPESDLVTTARAGATLYVPIRMSQFRLGYEGNQFFYQDNDQFSGNTTQVGSVEFDANFSTHDQLRVATAVTRGVTEQQSAATGGEQIGLGFNYDRFDWSVEWRHEAYQQPSWRVKVANTDRSYDTQEFVTFYDVDGWDVEYEWAQPIYRRGYITSKVAARRQRQQEVGTGVLLKRELYDGYEAGFRGVLGKDKPFVVSLGYGRLDFREGVFGFQPSTFSGFVGDLRWQLPVGGSTDFEVGMTRRPVSSFFNTYYINSELRTRFSRTALGNSRYGLTLVAARADYRDDLLIAQRNPSLPGNPLVLIPALGCSDVRQDDRFETEAYWEWYVQPRVALRVRANHNRLDSNCSLASFTSTGAGVLMRVGWF